MAKPDFVLCVKNEGHQASLEVRKLYQVLPDPGAAAKQAAASSRNREKITFTRRTISWSWN